MTAIKDIYSNKGHFKDKASLTKALGIDGLNNAIEIIDQLRNATPLGVTQEDWDNHLSEKSQLCIKSEIAERCASLGLPSIPTIVPKTLDEVKKFVKENETVILKPSLGHDCIGNKEYHYRPIKEAELLEEIELDLNFIRNQNDDKAKDKVVMQKFISLDGKDSYHYSFKGWIDNDGKFTLNHSYTEEWSVDPHYDYTNYNRLTKQALSNALNVSTTTYETDKAIDDEVVRQTNEFCKGNIDSCFMHGDAIIIGGKVHIIDMSPISNFPTMVSFALDGITRFLIFPIIMPKKGDRKKHIDLASKHNGYYTFSNKSDPTNYKYNYFLFRGESMKEIQDSRDSFTKAIFN